LRVPKPLNPAYPNVLKTLGDHLKKKRLDLKLLQGDIAQKFGTSEASIHNWEMGHTTPSPFFVPKIAEFLGYVPFEMNTKTVK